jgi:hypothetical protein
VGLQRIDQVAKFSGRIDRNLRNLLHVVRPRDSWKKVVEPIPCEESAVTQRSRDIRGQELPAVLGRLLGRALNGQRYS